MRPGPATLIPHFFGAVYGPGIIEPWPGRLTTAFKQTRPHDDIFEFMHYLFLKRYDAA